MAQRVSIYRPQMRVPELQAPQIRQLDVSSGFRSAGESVTTALEQQRARDRARVLNENRLEATTKLEELQFEAEKLPWDQRAGHFQAGANALKAELDKRAGDDSALKEAFANDWGQLYLPRNSQVKFSARKGEIDHNVAVLEESTTVFARQAAQASDPREAQFIKDQAALSIADAQQGGFLTEVEAGDRLRDFARGVERNRARSLIEDDPSQGLRALNDLSKFQNLREEDRLALVDRAENKIQHRVAMADHAAVVGERNRRIMGDQIAKEGADLLAKGQMTEAWLETNRRVLDGSDYRVIRHEMQNGGGTDSASVTADLFDRLYVKGEDIGPDAINAMRTGTLSVDSAKSLLNENKSTQDIQSPRRQGLAYITTSLKVSDANDDPVAAQRLANAVASFNQQMREDPKQDPIALSRTLVKTQALLQWDQMNVLRPLPKHAVGDRMTFDVKAARAATAAQFLKKHGGDRAKAAADPDFIREGKLINDWEAARKRLQAANEAAAAKAKK